MQGAGPEGGHLGLKWDATVTGIGLTSFATTLAPSLCSSNKIKINIEEKPLLKLPPVMPTFHAGTVSGPDCCFPVLLPALRRAVGDGPST